MNRLLAVIIFMVGLIVLANTRGDFGILVNIPSLIIVVFGTAALMFAKFGFGLSDRDLEPRQDQIQARYGLRVVLTMGILGELIDLVATLSSFSDPSAIGPIIAVSTLPFLYSVIIAVFWFLPRAGNVPFLIYLGHFCTVWAVFFVFEFVMLFLKEGSLSV